MNDVQQDTHSLFSASDTYSLFDELEDDTTSSPHGDAHYDDNIPAIRTQPPIPGLFFDPSVLLPSKLANEVVSFCMRTYFVSPLDNQVMLFGRFTPPSDPLKSSTGFPPILSSFLEKISSLLQPILCPETYHLLFPAKPTTARQAIINLYQPGEGITPHVDLLGRYGDGIIGVSFSSGSVMRFDKVRPVESDTQTRWDVYLPELSIIVLSQEARFDWTHGIDKKTKDYVSDSGTPDNPSTSWIERGTRLSVTFRWMLPGAEVVGDGQS